MKGALSRDSLNDMKSKDTSLTFDRSTDSLEALREALDAGMVVLQANTRAQVVFPSEVEIPESGTTNYRLYLYLFDSEGEMEAPDSTPTITIINSAGGEEVAETSMTNVDTGRYYYTVAIANTETPANWIAQIKVIEGGDTRYYGANFDLVHDSVGTRNDTTTDTIHGKLGTDTELNDRSIADVLFIDGPPGTFPTAAAPGDDVSFAEILRYISENQLGTSFDGTPDMFTQLGAFNTYTTLNKVSLVAWLGIPNTASYHSFYEYIVAGADTSANPAVAADEDGSIMERLEQMQEVINKGSGTAIGANKSIVDLIGSTGLAATTHDYNDLSLLPYMHGYHGEVTTLFIIPEAVGSINADNTILQTELGKMGEVITITQADALVYPDFSGVTLCVLGTNSSIAWTTANLADIKTVPNLPIVCVDKVAAAYLELGTDGGDANAKTDINAVANIEGTIIGAGFHERAGLDAGANTVSSSATYHTLDMSNANITEVWFAYESVNANTDVVIGIIERVQPDGTIGIDETGAEVAATMAFYGCGYDFSELNTLGLDVFNLLCERLIHGATIGQAIIIAGDIGSLSQKLFGNMTGQHNAASPLSAFISGNSGGLGTELPNNVSLYDLVGAIDGYSTLGKTDLVSWLGLPDTASYHSFYQYLVTGADTSANPNIGENADGSILERLEVVQNDVSGLAGAAERGTDNAATVADGWDAALATILDNFTPTRIGYLDELDFDLTAAIGAIPTAPALVSDGWDAALATILDNFTPTRIGYLDELDFDLTAAIGAIPTTMVGTNNAALASVLGALTDAAGQDADSNAFTAMQHLKGLHDVLWDDAGVAAWAAAAAPANGVSISEAIRYIVENQFGAEYDGSPNLYDTTITGWTGAATATAVGSLIERLQLLQQAGITTNTIFTAAVSSVNTLQDAALLDVGSNYIGQMVIPLAGNMEGQGRYITGYNGTNTITVSPDWAADPGTVDFIIVPTPLKGVVDSQARVLLTMDFWSLPQEEVAVTAGAGDKALPSVTVADLPSGATVVRAIAIFKFRVVENTNVAANKLSGAQEIQVDIDAVAGWIDAINFVDDLFTIAASTREGGDVIMGAIDIAAKVTANDTYIFQWDEAVADVANLNFNDVQVGLRIWYSI